MIDLLLFDLDGLLLRTDDLEAFRGRSNLGAAAAPWRAQLAGACRGRANRLHYTEAHIQVLRQGRRIGVFTRSPRAYAETLLATMYPNIAWDIVIAFEDVARTKPEPDGIYLAMERIGVGDIQRVALVGDEKVDVQTAYCAGCWCVLDRGTWPEPKAPENYWALERVPDVIVNGPDELIARVGNLHAHLPELERLMSPDRARLVNPAREDKIKHFAPRELGRESAWISVLGRSFSGYEALRRRASWHQLTYEIGANKSATCFPDHWISALRTAIKESWPVKNSRPTVITVVPFKPGRPPRLEQLLAQLQASHRAHPFGIHSDLKFVPDLMRYRDGVLGHSSLHLNQLQRFENVRDHLEVARPEVVRGNHVIVIDDVITTGASLVYADKYLREAGARNVSCVALAHAIGPR